MTPHRRVAGPVGSAPIVVDCHRRLRGPYTGLGSLLRTLVPRLPSGLVAAHTLEIVTIAPELRNLLDTPPETFTSIPKVRIRVHGIEHTRRLAHGAVDLLLAAADLTVSFVNVDQADPTDQEFLAILLRRAAGTRVGVVVEDGLGRVSEELAGALRTHATQRAPLASDRAESLEAFIESDGTLPEPAAYRDADPQVRAALHDKRAAELRATGEWSLLLGAVPYHQERGGDPDAAGQALLEAAEYCLSLGFFDALLDLGLRGRAVTDPVTRTERYWLLSGKTGTALAVLGRLDEAEPMYVEPRAMSALPMLHLNNSYSLAMLAMRRGRPDEVVRGHLNNAIAIASLLPDPADRAYYSVISQVGLGLLDLEAGDAATALRRITEGVQRLDRDLPPDAYLMHRSVLVHNRATVLLRLDRPDEALEDFDRAIALDPTYPEYHIDRGAVLVSLGRPHEALADYDAAVSLSPPFWELHLDRAAVRAETGDPAGALADLTRAVDLEPAKLEPWVALANLLLELGDLPAAGDKLTAALSFHPDDPRLLCARAQLCLEEDRPELARRDFDRALAADGTLVVALAGRAALAYEAADHDSAISDLSRAIEATEDPDLLFNRAQVYREIGDLEAAIADYTRALDLPGADRAELLRERDRCHPRSADVP